MRVEYMNIKNTWEKIFLKKPDNTSPQTGSIITPTSVQWQAPRKETKLKAGEIMLKNNTRNRKGREDVKVYNFV